jgi:hypothetical protein
MNLPSKIHQYVRKNTNGSEYKKYSAVVLNGVSAFFSQNPFGSDLLRIPRETSTTAPRSAGCNCPALGAQAVRLNRVPRTAENLPLAVRTLLPRNRGAAGLPLASDDSGAETALSTVVLCSIYA